MEYLENFKVELFQNHYGKNTKSMDVTSSYWENCGFNHVDYDEANNRVRIKKGHGFGDFIRIGSLATLKYIFPHFSLKFYLNKFNQNPEYRKAMEEICSVTGRMISFDCCKQLIAVESLLKNIGIEGDEKYPFTSRGIDRVCIVGDGYGFMGSLIKRIDSRVKIVWINLGRQLLFDLHFSNLLFAGKSTANLVRDKVSVNLDSELSYIEAENAELVGNFPVNLFINVASFQEMDVEVVQKYFRLIAENKQVNGQRVFAYSINRIEKTLPDGTILRSKEFPWKDSRIIHESLPEWYTKFPTNTPPFWQEFDGPHHERLAEF